jgi:hypothetical protein
MGASNKMAIPQAASSAVKYAFHPWFLTMMDRGTPALAAPVQQTLVVTSLYFALHRQFLTAPCLWRQQIAGKQSMLLKRYLT